VSNRLESDADSSGYKIILNATTRKITMTRVSESVASLVIAVNDMNFGDTTMANPSMDIILRSPSDNSVLVGTKFNAAGVIVYGPGGTTRFSINGGKLYMPECPTSNSGLYAGQVYRDGTTLKIV